MPTKKIDANAVHPLDSLQELKDWLFYSASCHTCGILNSQVDGHLFQCSRCKKVCYCSKDCYNRDLSFHQGFCLAGSLSRAPMDTPKQLMPLDVDIHPFHNSFPDFTEKIDDPIEIEETPKEAPELTIQCDTKQSEYEDYSEFTADDESVQAVMTREVEKSSANKIEGTKTKPRRFLVGDGVVPTRSTHDSEVVVLRESIEVKQDYEWEKPEWALRSPLRPTAQGQIAKDQGNLAKPVTNARVLIEKGDVRWSKPLWTRSVPLRNSSKSEVVKQGGSLAKPITMIQSYVERGLPSWTVTSESSELNSA